MLHESSSVCPPLGRSAATPITSAMSWVCHAYRATAMPRALRLRMRLVRQYVKGGGHQCAQLLLTPRIAPPRIRAGLGPAGSLGKGTHSLRLAPSRARPSCITRFAQRRVWSVQPTKRRAQLSSSTRPSAGPLYPRPLRGERSARQVTPTTDEQLGKQGARRSPARPAGCQRESDPFPHLSCLGVPTR